MSNSKNILYLISLMLLMLTGCEADTSIAPFPNEGEEPVEVRLHATTVGAGVEVSRATALDGSSQIGMTGGTYQNLTLTYDNNTKALKRTDQGTIYYPLQTDTMYIYAYAPFKEEAYISDEDSVKVKSDWETSQDFDDYITDPIWANTTVTKNNPTGTLTFKHAMSKLQIYLVSEVEGKTYTNISLAIDFDRSQYGKMSMETGEISPAQTGDCSYEKSETTLTLNPKGSTNTPQLDFTILPGTVLKKVRVYFNGLNEDFVQEFTETNQFPAFEAGMINRIVINFRKIEEKASQVNVSLEDYEFENEDEIYI